MQHEIRPADFALARNIARQGRQVAAYAVVRGSEDYPDITGLVLFSPAKGGTWVDVEVRGLPPYVPSFENSQPIGPFGFHVHEGSECMPEGGVMPFDSAHGHYNPDNQPHGNHAGDLPVLFSSGGDARMSFYTNRFKPSDVIGKTVIIHQNPDDYRTQPAGNSGKRIACGVIQKAR